MARGEDERSVPRRARRADAAANARSLVSAARELFDEHGPEVALDVVARRAGVGNATLYRHFPTRADLLVAVYAEEAAALCRRGAGLLHEASAGDALFDWLDDLLGHMAGMRALVPATAGGRDDGHTELFRRSHDTLTSTAEDLLERAKAAGALHPDLAVADVLALTGAAAIAAGDTDHARRLLQIMRRGLEVPDRKGRGPAG
ncbi:MAG TPA: helix-turn-helix domain-containing protein [Actinoallomurus sp.]|nr:helix-turn-helix domain-containing protein [Actinoallomurus sp.]